MTARRRLLVITICLPIAVMLTGALAYQYRIHLGNRVQASIAMRPAIVPTRDSSIVIFAPHCDDETLGAGGLIQTARKAGAKVAVVVMTNGDGFWMAADMEYREVRLRPEEYVRFAEDRQRETERAAGVMGLSAKDLIFLSYPDRGLTQMWTTNWNPESPFTSRYTKLDHSPYPNSYRRNASYCGQNVLDDVRSILSKLKPTDVYVTHPSDDHPDHAAAYAFVTAAAGSLVDSGDAALARTRIHTYLIHRGEWPMPMAYKPKASLAPPFAMARLDTDWDSLPLTPEIVTAKRDAILCHRSQVAIMRKFLLSFARRNEIFGDLPDMRIPAVQDGRIQLDGSTAEWAGIPPAEMDPVADKLVRGLEKSGDIKAVYLSADSANVYVRVDFRKNLSKRVAYKVQVRTFGRMSNGDITRMWTATVRPPNTCDPPGTYFAWKGQTLELMIPRSNLEPMNRLFVTASDSAMGLTIDSTGWRGYRLGGD
jgi:LmbE family N-acetylglucosaminyl deacetylase